MYWCRRFVKHLLLTSWSDLVVASSVLSSKVIPFQMHCDQLYSQKCLLLYFTLITQTHPDPPVKTSGGATMAPSLPPKHQLSVFHLHLSLPPGQQGWELIFANKWRHKYPEMQPWAKQWHIPRIGCFANSENQCNVQILQINVLVTSASKEQYPSLPPLHLAIVFVPV